MSWVKRGVAATGLVLSLGLIAPSSLGGSVSADFSPNNPNAFTTTLTCTIGGEDIDYEVITTGAAASFQDMNSPTVFIVAYAEYVGTLTATNPADPDLDFFDDGEFGPGNPNGKKKGQKARAVTCTSTDEFDFEGDGEFGVEGVEYHALYVDTWYVTMSGNTARVQSASVDDQSADRQGNNQSKHKKGKQRGKGKRGR